MPDVTNLTGSLQRVREALSRERAKLSPVEYSDMLFELYEELSATAFAAQPPKDTTP